MNKTDRFDNGQFFVFVDSARYLRYNASKHLQ